MTYKEYLKSAEGVFIWIVNDVKNLPPDKRTIYEPLFQQYIDEVVPQEDKAFYQSIIDESKNAKNP